MLRPPGIGRVALNLLLRGLPRRLSLNECLYFSPRLGRELRAIADRTGCHLVVADMLRTGPVAGLTGLPVVANLHDPLATQAGGRATDLDGSAGGGETACGRRQERDDPRSLVSYTDLPGLRRREQSGSLEDGMLPKASAIESAIRGGVRRVHVISFDVRDSVLAEVFTNEGTGTLIVADIKALTPAEQVAAIRAALAV